MLLVYDIFKFKNLKSDWFYRECTTKNHGFIYLFILKLPLHIMCNVNINDNTRNKSQISAEHHTFIAVHPLSGQNFHLNVEKYQNLIMSRLALCFKFMTTLWPLTPLPPSGQNANYTDNTLYNVIVWVCVFPGHSLSVSIIHTFNVMCPLNTHTEIPFALRAIISHEQCPTEKWWEKKRRKEDRQEEKKRWQRRKNLRKRWGRMKKSIKTRRERWKQGQQEEKKRKWRRENKSQ